MNNKINAVKFSFRTQENVIIWSIVSRILRKSKYCLRCVDLNHILKTKYNIIPIHSVLKIKKIVPKMSITGNLIESKINLQNYK